MWVNCYNLFFISADPKQTESMCSFTPHFTQGGLTLDSDANGGLDQVKVGSLRGSAIKEPSSDKFLPSCTTS